MTDDRTPTRPTASSTGDAEIVLVPVEQARPWLRTMRTAILDRGTAAEFEQRLAAWTRDWPVRRAWGARAAGQWVGTLATEPRSLTVPGPDGGTRRLDVDALTGVAVSATHRRRGLLTAMITESLQAAVERADALSILVAAEWPIYGRFGYAPAAAAGDYTYFPRRARVQAADYGRIEPIDPADVAAFAADVFDRARAKRPGQVDRSRDWWSRRLGLDGYLSPVHGHPTYVVHIGADGPDGLLAWRPTRDFELDGALARIAVDDLIAADDLAYRNLWAYLGGIDAVGEVELVWRPVDEPIRWLLDDGRALRQDYAGDALWIRILDVAAALSARAYRSEGSERLVLEVDDDAVGGYARGRFALDVHDGNAVCARTTDLPELRLSARALSSAYLGGFTLHQRRLVGDVEEVRPGARERFDRLFSTPCAPWLATMF